MSNTTLKENVRKRWQKGVALLFALGILGLLLVMALGFATNSIFDQMIASNNGNSSAAKTIAQSGLERIRNMLQNYEAKMRDIAAPNNFMTNGIFGYSHSDDISVFDPDATNAGNSNAKSDQLQGFFSSYTTSWNSATMTPNINWIYLQADGKLTGRMAYIILNRADLDPAKLVKLNVDESYKPPLTEPQEVRLGVDANEINLRTIDSSITQPLAQNFNYSTNNPANMPGVFNGNSWLDLPFLFDQFSFNPLVPADVAWETKFTRWFICNSKNSPEAYWVDLNVDGKITSNEQFHRFNLARTDWDTFITSANDMYQKILLDDGTLGGAPNFVPASPPVSTLMQYTTAGTSDGYGIPWLAFFGYKSDGSAYTGADLAEVQGTFPSVIARRRQIAANLVEYCRTAITDTATHSAISDSPDWLTTAPNFTGNMKTPYINEIGGHVQVQTTITVDDISGKYAVNTNLNFFLYSELINIYAVAWTRPGLTLRVNGSFTYDYDIGKSTSGTNTVFINNFDVNVFNWRNGYGSCVSPINGVPVTHSDSNLAGGQVKAIISNVKFKITSAVLYEPGNAFYDYANINPPLPSTLASLENYNPPATGTLPLSSFAPVSDPQDGWFSFETEDPRQNLNPTDWTSRAGSDNTGLHLYAVWTADDSSGPVRGAVNTLSNPVTRRVDLLALVPPVHIDAETTSNPVNGTLSTAFIRNGPMVSPWELGFIHRGARWQTINLQEYDKYKAAKYVAGLPNIIPGGGKYTDTANGGGDANILDQIKMNSSTQNYKIDLNNEFQDPDPLLSNRYMVLYSLFKNIKSGSTMDLVNGISGGAPISDIYIGNIINSIISRTGSGANTYLTRAQVVNDIAAVEPILTICNTKAMKDEIIGKMINLVDFDSYYTVILVAQTIKDVGGNGSTIPINKKLTGDTTPTLVNAQLGKFDLTVAGSNYYYADDITSTVKVQALIHKKIDGTCEVLSVKYIQ